MSEHRDTGSWHTTTDHEAIREWADERDAVPVSGADTPGEPPLGVATDPADADRLSWDRFFDRFDREGLAFRYRDDAPAGGAVDGDAAGGAGVAAAHAVVDLDDLDEGGSPAEKTYEPEGVETDAIARGDTGDAAPVAFDRTESTTPDRADREATSTAAAGDQAEGPIRPTDALVLDEVRGHHSGDRQAEHVTFRNVAEGPVDLSGWTVANGDGRSYRFPEGAELPPGETLTLSAGDGDAADGYVWDADDPVWPEHGGTVLVETSTGDRVLEETY